jgi:thymidylate synthase
MCYIVAEMVGMHPKGIIGDLSNVHIYEPHLPMVNEQLNRDVDKYWKPMDLTISNKAKRLLRLNKMESIDSKEVGLEDFDLPGYESHPYIKAEMFAYDD